MIKNKNFTFTIGLTVLVSGILPVIVIISANKYFANWFWIGESFHAFIEGAVAFSAIMFTILFLMSELEKETAYQLWVSCALLCMGILSAFNACVPIVKTEIWFQSMSTLIGGFLFALVWLPVKPLFLNSKFIIRFVVIAVSFLGLYSVLFPFIIPNMVIKDEFTLTSKILNISGGVLFLTSCIFFVNNYRLKKTKEYLVFANLCLFFGLTGLLFHWLSTWGPGWWLWHFFRIVVYLYILKYIFTLIKGKKAELEKNFEELKVQLEDRTSALVKTNHRLQAIELRLGKIITSNAYSIIIINEGGIVIFVNPAAKTLFGRPLKEFIGQKFDFPIVPNKTSEIEIKKKNGKKIIAQMSIGELDWGGKIAYLVSCFDITEIAQLREKLKEMSFVDDLTKIYNRRGFFELARQQLKIAQRTKNVTLLIFVDIDNMKSINDTMGHRAGDLALIDTADILQTTFRKSDIIGRLGGDEFAVLAIEASKGNINTISRRLQENIDKHNYLKNRSYEISMSIGIARFYPESHITLDDLITQADEQMYLQKRKKKLYTLKK